MRKLCFVTLTFALALAACGGNDAGPSLITGGGVGSGSIDGRVNVYVIDETTSAPIAGAKVRVGKMDGTTDATGLFIAKGDLSGKQNVTAIASGHVPTMWVGVNGANVTIPVTATGTTSTTIAQAELDATIAGWDALTPSGQNAALIGVVSYTQTAEFGAAENNIAQPPGPIPQLAQITGNMCFKAQIASPACAPKVNSRTGRVALVATILDRDSKGTATTADDTVTVIGYAAKTALTVVDGQKQTGLELAQIAAGDTGNGGIAFGTPPAALTQVQGLIGVDLGQDGIAYLANVLTPAAATMLIPKPSAFAGAKYRVLAIAQKATGGDAQSLVLKRDVADATSAALGTWLDTPTGIMAAGDTLSLAAVTGANLTGFEIRASGAADAAWSVTILDGSLSATLPTDLAPIPTGTDTLKASAIDATIDVGDFSLEKKFDLVNRLSSDSVTFTK